MHPRAHLDSLHAVLLAWGMIMSTDSVKIAPTEAANVGTWYFVALWVLAGWGLWFARQALVGAPGYVEVAASFPDAGDQYSFSAAHRAKDSARLAIKPTGWVALMVHLGWDAPSIAHEIARQFDMRRPPELPHRPQFHQAIAPRHQSRRIARPT
jgi:hypothetical protein